MMEAGASYFFQIRSVGGAVADVAEDATAYAHRSANFSRRRHRAAPERLDQWWADLADPLDGSLPELRGARCGPSASRRPSRLPTLARLRAIKAEVDPHHVFRDNFPRLRGPSSRAEARVRRTLPRSCSVGAPART